MNFSFYRIITLTIIGLASLAIPVHADQAYCQSVGNKTDLSIREVKNRYAGADASLPATLYLPGSLAFEVIVDTNECAGVNGTEVDLYDNNVFIRRISIPPATSNGGSSNQDFLIWTPGTLGLHALRFEVDPNNQIPEVSESNNSYTAYVTVSNTPSDTFDIRFLSMGSNNLLDPQVGNSILFTSKFIMENNTTKSGTFTVGWYVNSELVSKQEFTRDTTATQITPTFSWTPSSPGIYTVYVEADIYDKATEINEANNAGSVTFEVNQTSSNSLLVITNVEARNISDRSAAVYWQAGTGSMGEYRYATSRDELKMKSWQSGGVTNGATTGNVYGSIASFGGLNANTTYYVEVRKSLGNEYGPSKIISFTTLKDQSKNFLSITSSEVRDVTKNSATVYWQAGTGSMGEYRYAMSYEGLANTSWKRAKVDGVDTGNIYGSLTTLFNLELGTKYYVELRKSLNGSMGDSKVISFTTLGDNPLGLQSGMLIKNNKFAEVFWVDENLCLRWVINERAAEDHFGRTWNQNIFSYDNIPTSYSFCSYLTEQNNVAVRDTDKDGLSDEEERRYGTNPMVIDSDSDGLTDRDEVKVFATNPLNADTDGDGHLDGTEVRNGYNPLGSGRL